MTAPETTPRQDGGESPHWIESGSGVWHVMLERLPNGKALTLCGRRPWVVRFFGGPDRECLTCAANLQRQQPPTAAARDER